MAKKVKAKKPKENIVREFISVEHQYDDKEMRELTRTLTSAVQDKAEQGERLKSVSADYKARIKTADSMITETTNKITNGYEVRNIEATAVLDRDGGIKSLSVFAPGKPDHGKFIREEQMTDNDYAKLPLQDLPPEKLKAEKKGKKKKGGDEVVAAEPAEKTETEENNAGESAEG